eukprot:5712227-Karenia_brevis.AAC.1
MEQFALMHYGIPVPVSCHVLLTASKAHMLHRHQQFSNPCMNLSCTPLTTCRCRRFLMELA